jgi:preprotein translocase subunit SecF
MEQKINPQQQTNRKNWFDKSYKLLMILPILLTILAVVYLGFFYFSHNHEIILKDVSLSGGTMITLTADSGTINFEEFKIALEQKSAMRGVDISLRKLTDMGTGKMLSIIVESSSKSEELKADIENILGYSLTNDNSSTEFSEPSLGKNFFNQLMWALLIAFILMSMVIFIMFRTFIPSIAVIFAAFSDIIVPLAIVDLLGIKLSAAGIAAFLMLIGYSVDTDILLTTRALDPKKTRDENLNQRIFAAFKTGTLMTLTALFAVLPAFFIVTGLPDSFRQIFLILALGLSADLIFTWMANAGIIKWYCEKKGVI